MEAYAKFLLTDLTHEDIKDPCGDGQREGGEEDGEEPGGGIHGGVKALSLEMHVQLRELFLRGENHRFTSLPLSCQTVITRRGSLTTKYEVSTWIINSNWYMQSPSSAILGLKSSRSL